MAAIFTAVDISSIATAVGLLFVGGIGIRLLYKGYGLAKAALGRV
jgi:hypothetical protein